MSSPKPARARDLLAHGQFLLFLSSRSLSRFSSQIGAVAIGWQLYDLTGSAFDLGMVGLVQFLPTALLVFVAGHAADRFDRRRVMQLCQFGQALMPAMYHYTAIVTCLAVALHFFFALQVARARAVYGVKLPAITGNPDFERIYRIQMNTLEWAPIFLPSLSLFAIYIGYVAAAVVGAVWVIGRIVYFLGYREAVAKRTPRFAIQALARTVLWIGTLGGALWRLMH